MAALDTRSLVGGEHVARWYSSICISSRCRLFWKKAAALTAVIILFGCASACRKTPRTIAVDLLKQRPEFVNPTTVLRGGDESVRQLLLGGFSVMDGRLLAVPPSSSVVTFGFYSFGGEPRDVVFYGNANPPCEVALKVNGRGAGKMTIGVEKQNYFRRVPAAILKDGLNEASLHFPGARPPNGTLRAVFESIMIGGGETRNGPSSAATSPIRQTANSEVAWLVQPADDLLDFSFTAASSREATCEVEITGETDHIARRALWKSQLDLSGSRTINGEVDLRAFAGTPARLAARFRSGERSAQLDWNRVRLMRAEAKPIAPPVTKSASQQPNVVIFLVDTLRRDHLSLYGYRYPTSPELQKFGSQAVVCDRAISQCSWTSPTVASLFTGEYPSGHGIKSHGEQLHEGFTTIAEYLKQRTYYTLACVANTGIGNHRGYEQGFDDWLYMQRSKVPELVETAATHLGRTPFFLYVHVMDSHYPYRPADPPFDSLIRKPEGAVVRSRQLSMTNLRGHEIVPTDIELDYMRSLYDSEIASVDHYFGRLVQILKDKGLYENTLIVFISDHGEEFREHGGYYHGHTLYDELTRVALVLKPPAPFAPRRLSEPVQTIDVYPTIVGLAGGDPTSLPGRNLADTLRGDQRGLDETYPIFSETDLQADLRSIVVGRHKLVLQDRTPRGIADILRLYDLSEDPGEHRNRIQDEPIRGSLLAELVQKHQREVAGRLKYSAKELHKDLDPEMVRQLKELGYLGGGEK